MTNRDTVATYIMAKEIDFRKKISIQRKRSVIK